VVDVCMGEDVRKDVCCHVYALDVGFAWVWKPLCLV